MNRFATAAVRRLKRPVPAVSAASQLSPAAAQPGGESAWHRALRPDHLAAMPIDARRPVPLQRQLAVGAADHPLEAEADAMANRVVGGDADAASTARRGVPVQTPVDTVAAPAIVHAALGVPGKPLDAALRSTLEPHFGRDLSDVRVHTGEYAADSARALQARAYTVGQEVVFGAGQYRPHTREGLRLLAHEVSHTLQQSGGAGEQLSAAARTVHRDPLPTAEPQQPIEPITIALPPEALQRLQLTPPSLVQPSTPGLRVPSLTPPALTPPLVPGAAPPAPNLSPPTTAPTSPALSPPGRGSTGATPGAAPQAPDRLSFYHHGILSIGARFGLPKLSLDGKPGDPPSGLRESLKRAELLNFIYTGQPPSEYTLDPGKLIGALWGIFATNIDPALARKIAAGVASKPAAGGVSVQLDAMLLLNLGGAKSGGGGGATLTIIFP